MCALMLILIAAVVLPAAIGLVAPQNAWAEAQGEAGAKEAAPGKEKLPPAPPQKVVVTSPLAMDIVVTRKYSGLIRSQRHIEVRAPSTGYLETISGQEGQAVKKGAVLFKLLPTLDKAKMDVELADVQIAQLELANPRGPLRWCASTGIGRSSSPPRRRPASLRPRWRPGASNWPRRSCPEGTARST